MTEMLRNSEHALPNVLVGLTYFAESLLDNRVFSVVTLYNRSKLFKSPKPHNCFCHAS